MARRYEDSLEPADVEKLIYSGFYTSADKALLTQFQVAKPPDRKELLNEIADKRLRKLGHRILLNETPNLFADEHLSKAAVDCNVPTHWDENPQLSTWASTQRTNAKSEKLSDERWERLEAIGHQKIRTAPALVPVKTPHFRTEPPL